jgi:benzylsuccinate CoA-transferase BbsF subunit
LDYKRRTGKGQYIDLSQLEASIHFLTPWLLDYQVNGREGQRMGNKDRYACPHGVFRCLGEDRWIAIAVQTEEEWKGFCRAMGDPEWCLEEKFSRILSRKAHEEELNRRIDEWTSNFEACYLMALFQSHGVGAGAVLNPSQTHADPQLNHRRAKVVLDHKEIGPHGYLTSGSQFSKTPPEFRKSAPLLGEDTEWILREVLHYSEEEIRELEAHGALQ